MTEPAEVTLEVVGILDSLDVPYFIGGSFASAIHGVARMTADVDVVADLRLKDVELFASALQGDFYFDLDTIRESVSRRASFSVIHLRTMFKVDVFPARDRPFDRVQMERRQRVAITSEPDRIASVATAEDNVLAKLEWYRLGNEASERQWTDVLNVLRTQSGRLDIDHLRKWAEVLGVADLLTRALDEARSE